MHSSWTFVLEKVMDICFRKSYLNQKERLLTPLQLGTLCNSKIDSFAGCWCDVIKAPACEPTLISGH